MEKFCRIRDIYRSILEFEAIFNRHFGLNLNEAMLLCTLSEKARRSSGEIAEAMGLTCSNCSKVIVAVEIKNLIHRDLGNKDKRRMYFSLTEEGRKTFETLKKCEIDLPEKLKEIM